MMETKRRAAGSLLLLVLCFPLAAQRRARPGSEPERPKLPPGIEHVFGLAMGAPPEFAASALLRVESKVPENELRRELIDMAFTLAARSRHPVRLDPVPGLDNDSRTGVLANALKMNLDAMSLQAGAVAAMLGLDPPHARDLFLRMVRPPSEIAGCEDSLLPDVSSYYDALGAVIRTGFSSNERAQDQHVGFLLAVLNRTSGVRELEPALRLSAVSDLSRTQSDRVTGPLISKFSTAPTDPRSFLASAEGIDSAMSQFVSKLRSLKTSPDALVSAYREFLVRQYRAPRCTDGDPLAGGGHVHEIFGGEIRGELPQLGPEETTPQLLEGEMKLERFWQSATGQELLQYSLKLRPGPDGTVSPEWSRQVTGFLGKLAAWKSSDETSGAVYFHQKAALLETLLEVTPPGDLTDQILKQFMALLKWSNMRQQDPVEWFWHAHNAIARVRPDHPELLRKIEAIYRESGDIILMLESAVAGCRAGPRPAAESHSASPARDVMESPGERGLEDCWSR